MAASNKTQIVLSHDNVTAANRRYRQLANIQRSSFTRMLLCFAISHEHIILWCSGVAKWERGQLPPAQQARRRGGAKQT